MSSYLKASLIRGIVALVCGSRLFAATCSVPPLVKLPELLSFIRSARESRLDLDCVQQAYAEVALLPVETKVPIYLSLLSTKVPDDPEGTLIVSPPIRDTGFYYPAVGALIELKGEAEPAVLDYIANNSDHDRLAWENATIEFATSHMNHGIVDVIKVMKVKRSQLTDPNSIGRLNEAIHLVVNRYCTNERGAACQTEAAAP